MGTTLPVVAAFGFGTAMVVSSGIAHHAEPELIEAVPISVWRCELPSVDGVSPSVQSRFYFFGSPMEVDRYTPGAGIDRVGDINIIGVGMVGGRVKEYVFGSYRIVSQTYEITMRFGAQPASDGLKLLDHSRYDTKIIIDRNTGELTTVWKLEVSRAEDCSSSVNDFAKIAASYRDLLSEQPWHVPG